jgi:N-acetylmuramoyl-L-alanine amidase
MEIEKLKGPWKGRLMKQKPEGIIIHSMGEYINKIFASDFILSIGLSVHAFIGVDGKVYMAAGSDRVAYHAGKSVFKGKYNLNSSFLGFELLVPGEHNMKTFTDAIQNGNPYSDAQYEASAELCSQWMNEFEIPVEKVLGHVDVSGANLNVRLDPKIDPGRGFDWDRFRSLLT